jgi:HSP20 family protein
MLQRNYSNKMLSDIINDMMETTIKTNKYNDPAVNIAEEKENFKIEIAAPGLTKDQLKVEINKDSLIVFAEENKDENQKYVKREFYYGNFKKVYHIPEKVNRDKISASYTNGIFTIELPIKEEAVDRGPVQIAIS